MRVLTTMIVVFATLSASAQGGVEIKWTYEGTPYSTFSMSPDQQYVAGKKVHHGDVEIRDPNDFSLVKSLLDENRLEHEKLEFSPDGRFLALGQQGDVQIWNTDTWEKVGTFVTVQRWGAPFSFSTNSTFLFVGNGASIEKRSLPEGELVSAWDSPTFIVCMAVSTDGSRLATGTGFNGNDVAVRVWSVESGEKLLEIQPSLTYGVASIAYAPDGNVFATAREFREGSIEVWDAKNGSRVSTLTPSLTGTDLAFSSNGDILISIGSGGLFLWDWKVGKRVGEAAGTTKIETTSGLDNFSFLTAEAHVAVARLPVWLREPSIAGDRVSFEWLGRDGTFQLQRKVSLGGEWEDAGGPTAERGMSVPAEGATGFFRLVGGE